MRACIHCGTQEIGGTCIELETQGKRLALDVGLPLDADEADAERLLPAVPGFREPDHSLLGVVISHPHQDHYGIARHIRPDVPVYIGEAANDILKAAAPYVPNGHWFPDARFYRDREPFTVGPFNITPYLVDHSAFDAYALLIEADGQRVYDSGDFRAHGRKAGLVERMLRDPPVGIDVLMMEGTPSGGRAAGMVPKPRPTSRRDLSRRSKHRAACTSSGLRRRTSIASSPSSGLRNCETRRTPASHRSLHGGRA